MARGRIDCYLDIASFYSYVCFEDLLPNLDTLAAHGVQVEFHPVFLGAINHLAGNKPPWTLPAKAAYLARDAPRAASRVAMTRLAPPRDLLSRARTQSALRCLLFIKANFADTTFLAALRHLFRRFWTPPHAHVVEEATLRAVLAEAATDPDDASSQKLFTTAEVDAIMDGRAQMRRLLAEQTSRAVDAGAFGCPWLVVVDSAGRAEPFFGSDRFHHIYRYLGLPFQDIALLEPASGAASKL